MDDETRRKLGVDYHEGKSIEPLKMLTHFHGTNANNHLHGSGVYVEPNGKTHFAVYCHGKRVNQKHDSESLRLKHFMI